MSRFNPILAFISKLAIICNGCFVFSLLVMFMPKISFPPSFSNFVAVLGLEMAPVVSVLFGALFIIFNIKKYSYDLPKWQTIINLFMLLFELIFIIV